MIVALIALFLALGGTSYAVISIPKKSVGAAQLKKGAVSAPKVRANAIRSASVKDGSLLSRDFKAGQLPAGPVGPAGPAGPAGPSSAYYGRQTGTATLAANGATATLATLSLPAGSYTFSAQAYAFRQGANEKPDQAMCIVVSGTTVLGGLPSQITIDPTANLIFLAAATLPAPATVQLSCNQITPAADAADTLALIGGRLLATRVGELTTTP